MPEVASTDAAESATDGFEGSVAHVALDHIVDDDRFRFRATLRVGPLKKSLELFDQQQPIIVRRLTPKGRKYQLISGFRRVAALRALGRSYATAVVRDDLVGDENDERALRAAVLENTQRKTYTDIDRAYVIRSFEERGVNGIDVGPLLGISKRQKNNLKSLLDLPELVQEELSDPESAFKTTHALQLRKLQRKYVPDDPEAFDWPTWIERVKAEALSISQLVRAVNRAYRTDPPPTTSVLRAGSNMAAGVIHFSPIKLELSKLTAEERQALKAEFLEIAELLS